MELNTRTRGRLLLEELPHLSPAEVASLRAELRGGWDDGTLTLEEMFALWADPPPSPEPPRTFERPPRDRILPTLARGIKTRAVISLLRDRGATLGQLSRLFWRGGDSVSPVVAIHYNTGYGIRMEGDKVRLYP